MLNQHEWQNSADARIAVQSAQQTANRFQKTTCVLPDLSVTFFTETTQNVLEIVYADRYCEIDLVK